MTLPSVRLQLPDGGTARVAPGGIVGRLATAALRVTDPRVSEAAALVSMRGRELHLLALRGSLAVDGQAEDDVPLEVGQRIRLADVFDLVVVGVDVPEAVVALAVDDEPPRELCAPFYSLIRSPRLELVPWFEPGALARVWSTAEGWTIDRGSGPESIRPGRAWDIDGARVSARLVPVDAAGAPATVAGDERLVLHVRTTTVHIQREGRMTLTIDGVPARIVTELALIARPVEWSVVAREVWRASGDLGWLRTNWDRTLRRLRLRLREGGVRENLVRPDGRGNVELFLFAGDSVVDEA